MLKISIYFAAKSLAAPTTAGLTEYRKRLSKSCQFNWSAGISPQVKANPTVGAKAGLSDEHSKIQVILLDRKGQTLTSPQLAQQIQLWASQGKSHLVLLIGKTPEDTVPGSRGTDSESGKSQVRSEVLHSDDVFSLSLSPLALSVDVAGLLTAEQIYRAFRILENQPYHK